MKPLLICVTGSDGSGKSTACARVRELLIQNLGENSVFEVSVWDCLSEQATTQGQVSPSFKTPDDATRYLADLDGASRTLFILHAMSRALQMGLRKKSKVLILNGYWFKYAVSEIGYGVPFDVVLGAARGFPCPDQVYCLDIDAQTAWLRRQRASLYEQGPQASAVQEQAEVRFVAFQEKLKATWELIEKQSTPWQHLSAMLPPEELAQGIVSGVLKKLQDGWTQDELR